MEKLKQSLLLLLIVLIGATVSSCSDEDNPKNLDLVGTWVFEDVYSWGGYKNGVGSSFTFTENGIVEFKTWKIKDNKIRNEKTLTYKYKYDGYNLDIIDSYGESISQKVVIINDKITISGITYTRKR